MPRSRCTLVLGWLLCAPLAAAAVDGVIEINQAAALAGGVTPGDAPGFPVSLNAPGSYRLTGALVVPDGTTTAILVDAGSVAIDLNGFSITCAAPCTGNTGFGIDVVVALDHFGTSVRNGTIKGMGAGALDLLGDATVENMTLTDNGGAGIFAIGAILVRGCVVRGNAGDGIRVSGGSVVDHNSVSDNTGVGIFAEFGSVISYNHVSDSGGTGITCASDCSFFRNSVLRNAVGISGDGAFTDNTVTLNVGYGLSIGTGAYAGNVIYGNDTGGGTGEVIGGIEIGINRCGGDTLCP
jgi:hypothetical protein